MQSTCTVPGVVSTDPSSRSIEVWAIRRTRPMRITFVTRRSCSISISVTVAHRYISGIRSASTRSM